MATGSVEPEDRARKRRKQSVRNAFCCLLRFPVSVVAAARACSGCEYLAARSAAVVAFGRRVLGRWRRRRRRRSLSAGVDDASGWLG